MNKLFCVGVVLLLIATIFLAGCASSDGCSPNTLILQKDRVRCYSKIFVVGGNDCHFSKVTGEYICGNYDWSEISCSNACVNSIKGNGNE